ncbi:MAG: ATPase domain-containing protein, partial [Polyangiales bacterium]
GTAGAGKSSISAHFAGAAGARGERCLYFSFEESPSQMKRNMLSIGLDLARYERRGLLHFVSSRPTAQGLENHLARMYMLIERYEPQAVVVDPIGNLASGLDAHTLLIRLIDHLKTRNITALLTSLTSGNAASEEATEVAVSSLVDTWLLVKAIESNGERNRGLYILKSRGMAHSNQVREFVITSGGIELVDVYVGAGGVLTGSARLQQEAREKAETLLRHQELERLRRQRDTKQQALQSQIDALRVELERTNADFNLAITQAQARSDRLASEQLDMATKRGQDAGAKDKGRAPKRERQSR